MQVLCKFYTILSKFCSFQLFERCINRETETEFSYLLVQSPKSCNNCLGQTEARSLGLQLGVPCGWQGLQQLSPHLLAVQGICHQETELKVEQGLKLWPLNCSPNACPCYTILQRRLDLAQILVPSLPQRMRDECPIFLFSFTNILLDHCSVV